MPVVAVCSACATPPRSVAGSRPTVTALADAVAAGVSGQEPASTGFAEDVAIAAERDVSTVVPVRDGNGAFAPG
ncbi:hypothetical protein AB0I69_03740 [Streptomyces sp. NPDC050508]|uniref:hypothetical protein n=1 Tax=Streptomyces sp. NPDC050508 TaxID=3155405 RepID=UPI00342608DB